MSTNLRHDKILALLEENGAVSVRKLTSLLYVSEATVRRDLAELEKKGALKRTFGGATSALDTGKQIPLFIRKSLNSSAKSEICRQAAMLVKDGDTVFVDGSSTAQYLVKYLAHLKNITVVTYSIKTAELMCESHVRTYCTGGLLLENSLVCTGEQALSFAKRVNPDICFISCKGVDADGKFSDTSEEETLIRRAFMENSRTIAMLMTKNKFGSRYFHTLCTADKVDYIFSDGELPENIKTRKQQID